MRSQYPLSHPNFPKVILASASPRRRELLTAAGFEFELLPTFIDERRKRGESPRAYVSRLAFEKADAARTAIREKKKHQLPFPILGADTTVIAAGKILAKPTSPRDARRMLRMLSSRRHVVLTGLCLLAPIHSPRNNAASKGHKGHPESGTEIRWNKFVRVASTAVKFRRLSAEEIAAYVSTGEPMDKAGAYAIQGYASKFVTWISGCYFNVVGLPVSLLYEMLMQAQSRDKQREKR